VRVRAVDRHEKESVQGSEHHCLTQLRRANFSQDSVDFAKKVFTEESRRDDPPFRQLMREFLELVDKSDSMEYKVFVEKVDDLVDRACDLFIVSGVVPNFGYRIRDSIKCLVVKSLGGQLL